MKVEKIVMYVAILKIIKSRLLPELNDKLGTHPIIAFFTMHTVRIT